MLACQWTTASRLLLCQVQLMMPCRKRGLRRLQREPVALRIDLKQDITLADLLVVRDQDTGNFSRNLGNDGHALGIHPAIAGPWLDAVMPPQQPRCVGTGDNHR